MRKSCQVMNDKRPGASVSVLSGRIVSSTVMKRTASRSTLFSTSTRAREGTGVFLARPP